MTFSRPFTARPLLVSLSLALLLAFAIVPAALAATRTVDGNCPDTNSDGLCNDTVTYRTVAAAIAAASPGDVIDIVTSPAHTEAGVTVNKRVAIQGQGQNTTIWQAAATAGTANDRLFTVSPGTMVTVTALTLRYGDATSEGGAIYNQRGTLTLQSVSMLTNTTTGGGGAIYNEGDGGTATLRVYNSLFQNNTGEHYFYGGGAIYNSADGGTARAYVESSQFLSNTTGAMGGAISNETLDSPSFAFLDVISSTLAYNHAVDGGGAIYNFSYNRDGGVTVGQVRVMLTSTVLSNNVVNNPALDLSVAGGGGGGGENGNGGAVYSGALDTGSFAEFTAVNSTISNNSTDGAAGGLYNYINNRDNFTTTITATARSFVTLTQVTVYNNLAGDGVGGLYVDNYDNDEWTRVELFNTILSGNFGAECAGGGDKVGVSNYIDDTTCGSGAPFRLGSTAGFVEALADNGGPTRTNALNNASPAVDTASGTYCPATDQRGIARPQVSGCDVGAYEGVASTPTLILEADPPDGQVGAFYIYSFAANGFPITITLQAGTLPPGLTLSTNGVLSGTPTLTGTYSGIVVRASNSQGFVDSGPQTIEITTAGYKLYLPLVTNGNAPAFITYSNYEITPEETTIKAGTQVTFLIEDSNHQPYNDVGTNQFTAPADLDDGDSYVFTFTQVGTVTILCTPHPSMTATINVVP